jgi:hypothetical protein
MNTFVFFIKSLLIHLTKDIRHLIKLSFNAPKPTRGLDIRHLLRARGLGGDMEARPVSNSRGLRIIGPMWALASSSDSILVLLLLCF